MNGSEITASDFQSQAQSPLEPHLEYKTFKPFRLSTVMRFRSEPAHRPELKKGRRS